MKILPISKYIILYFLIVCLQFVYTDLCKIFNNIIYIENISNYIISVVSGLFGFIIAAIPLTFQLLVPTRKTAIMDEKTPIERLAMNEPMQKKIFAEYIKILYACLTVVVAVLVLEVFKGGGATDFDGRVLIVISSAYFILFLYFLVRLFELVKLLSGLIKLYFNSKIE